jgi:hypothetical protein
MQNHWKGEGNSSLSFGEVLKVAEVGKQVAQFDGGLSGENAFDKFEPV